MKALEWKLFFCLVLVSIFLITGCGDDNPAGPTGEVDVGIYEGPGSWDVSVTALQHAVVYAGYEVELFNDETLFTDGMGRYNVVVFPGGDPRTYQSILGSVGMQRIRSFVQSGGGFFGLGGGAVIASVDSADIAGASLFEGRMNWHIPRIAPYPEYTLTGIYTDDLFSHAIQLERDNYLVLYRWGPEFFPDDQQSVDVIFRYDLTATAALVAFEYGAGKVVLSGCQLEIEENDIRDGVTFGDEFEDPESEWELIAQILKYCMSF